jgi:hypothetical protein
MSPPVSDPFSPPRARSETKSKNPKTIANRKSIHSKDGLEIAEFRADASFRANKCRKLQALHRHPQWASWSDKKKKAEESKVVEELEAKREERKRKAEIAYNVKWELGDSEELSDAADDADAIATDGEKDKSDESLTTGMELVPVDPTLKVAVDEREPSAYTEVKGRRNKRRRVTMKPREKVSDDDGWVTDDSVVADLCEKKEEGGKNFFGVLSEFEAKATAADAELTAAILASVADKKR